MIPPPDALKSAIEQSLPGVSLAVEGAALIVAPPDVTALCRHLNDHADFSLD